MAHSQFVKKLWISAGVIAASVVIALIAINFFAGKLASDATTIVTDRAMIQQQTDAVSELANLEQQAPQAAEYQAAIDQVLPDGDTVFNFGQWFSQLGGQYGVTATASLQGTAVPSAGSTPGTVSFSFSAQGSLSAITAFLDAASTKSAGFLFTLTSFDMTTNGAGYQITGQGTAFSR